MLAPFLAMALMMQTVLDEDRGMRLYHACQTEVRFWDGESKTKTDDYCVDFIDGFIDGNISSVRPIFCVGDATTGAMVRVYLKYMEANPKELDKYRAAGVLHAFIDSYPCLAPKPPKGKSGLAK